MKAPTKQDLIDALTHQNISLTGEETVAELKQLIQDNAITLTDPKEIAEAQASVGEDAPKPLKTGVIKEYTQNGHRYLRIRAENGVVTDVRQ